MVFTGIVQGMAEIADISKQQDFHQLRILFPEGKTEGATVGGSVAINGTCLTVTSIAGSTLSFDVMKETLRATNLGKLDTGSPVNFERAAKYGDEIGGHNVSGHVHCTAELANVEVQENNRRLTFRVNDAKWMRYILPKGFIAVDGASLTVGEVWDDCFSVYLIPETIKVTVLGSKALGDSVNIEVEAQTQAIVDTVERVVAQYLSKQQHAIAS
jgi:riboflavin synthase